MCVLIFAQMLHAEPSRRNDDIAFTVSPEWLMTTSIAKIRDLETLSLDGLTEKDRKAALSRLQELPKLTTLEFYSCDLSKIAESDPVPAKVKTVLIAGGKVSQGTIGWLARFPSGTTLIFGCDVHGLDFNLGKFSWLTFDGCKLSRSSVTKLIETMTQVTFKEVTLIND
jgi:hypothetical protein